MTTITWWSRRQPGQPAADLDRRPATDAGVDLVEDHGGHRLGAGQAHLDGQHDPGQLAAGRAALHRQGRARPGCGCSRISTSSTPSGRRRPVRAVDDQRCSPAPGVRGATVTRTRASGIARPASSAVITLAQPSAAACRAAPAHFASRAVSPASGVPLGRERGQRLVGDVAGRRAAVRPARPRPGRGQLGRRTCGSAASAGRGDPRPRPAGPDPPPEARRTAPDQRPGRRRRADSSTTRRAWRPALGRRPPPCPGTRRAMPSRVARRRHSWPDRRRHRAARRAPYAPRGAARPRAPAATPGRAARRPLRLRGGRRDLGHPCRSMSASRASSRGPGRPVGQAVLGRPPRPKPRGVRRDVDAPANRSRAPRCSAGRVSRIWSDWPCTANREVADVAEHRHGHRRPAGEPARASACADRASQHQVLSASSSPPASSTRCAATDCGSRSSRPSMIASSWPPRTRLASPRPPNSNCRPVTTMVLPAPVSPVTTVSPGPSGSTASSMTPRPRMRSSSSTIENASR